MIDPAGAAAPGEGGRMPAAEFKPLSIGSLPRVMVAILAMSKEDREVIALELHEQPLKAFLDVWFAASDATSRIPTADNLAEIFDAVLQRPKNERALFVQAMDRMLDRLRDDDVFGTEGQIDPRGDHRD
jgi:hypothetical protein